jgi:ubiquinone/menaquinone biosynthesis C-methylase UbiE
MPDAEALRAILARCEEGAISPAIALMEMLIETEDAAVVAEVVRASSGASPNGEAIRRLVDENRAGCARIAAMLQSGADAPPRNASVAEGVAFCRRLFDWSVRQSEEASVALYSLGNPELLAQATREIVDVFAQWGALGPERRALDIGCGIGRMEVALAPHLASIHGIDVSGEMLSVARARCAALGNVSVSACSGLDLEPFDDASFDLVFSIDAFPYLMQAGRALVEAHVAESARVLRPGGELVVLNFSYRNDIDADRRDVAVLAAANALTLVVNGHQPFGLWNGAAFRMRKSSP